MDDINVDKLVPLGGSRNTAVDGYTIAVRVLRFFVALARDQVSTSLRT